MRLIKRMAFVHRLEVGEWVSGERSFQIMKTTGAKALRWENAQHDGRPATRPLGLQQ